MGSVQPCPTCGQSLHDHERDKAIYEQYCAGWFASELAHKYGVSKTRIHQLLNRHKALVDSAGRALVGRQKRVRDRKWSLKRKSGKSRDNRTHL